LPKQFVIQGLLNGEWVDIVELDANHQRVFKAILDRELEGVRYLLKETWGGMPSRVFHFSVK
jgi:hypothetical protein